MNAKGANVLTVDDDPSIRHALKTTLTSLGFTVQEAATGEDAYLRVKQEPFDAVLLDMNLPGAGGMAACRYLREVAPAMPILILTVRDGQDDIVSALDAGADDYITKPFHVREVAARLRAAIRRNRNIGDLKVLTAGDLTVDLSRRTVSKRGEVIHLTPKEFDLLHQLVLHSGMPVTHAKLLRTVWGPEYGGELEYLRTFMRQLRLKIEDEASRPKYLKTEPYVGYRFCEPRETKS